MKTSIKTLSFIAGIVLLASCSKSLTDIGYEGGSTTTTLPPDGPAFHTSIQKTGGEYIGAHAVQAGIHGEGFPHNVQYRPAMSIAARTGIHQKLYQDMLTKKFNYAKFCKKYNSRCSKQIQEKIDSLSSGAFAHKDFLGWEIFLGKNMKAGTWCTVSYEDDDWYKATLSDNDNSPVYIRVENVGTQNIPTITGIVNSYYNIEI